MRASRNGPLLRNEESHTAKGRLFYFYGVRATGNGIYMRSRMKGASRSSSLSCRRRGAADRGSPFVEETRLTYVTIHRENEPVGMPKNWRKPLLK